MIYMPSKNIDNKEIKETINLTKKHIIIVIITILLITIAGTFAWLSWKSNETALVLTVGDINSAQVILKPYQINSTITPVLTYENEEYTDIAATNNSTTAKVIKLFYKINNIDPELVNTNFKYTITKSTDNGSTYTEYLSGDFSTASTDTEFYIMEEKLPKSITYKYKVYIWLSSSDENQVDIQGKSFNGELRATIEEAPIITATDLVSKANPSTLTYADATDSQKREMWTFSHDATEQTEATTDYRYIGGGIYCSYESGEYRDLTNSDGTCSKKYRVFMTWVNDGRTSTFHSDSCPSDDSYRTYECTELTTDGVFGVEVNNYITFNDEVWRIIGVFDGRIKIIRNESIGNMTWDYKKAGVGSSTTNRGSNDWSDSQLMYMLNPTSYKLKDGYTEDGTYIYDGSGNIIYQLGCRPASISSGDTSYSCSSTPWSLNSTALSQISEVIYYLGGIPARDNHSASAIYAYERGTTVYSGRPTNWTGLVGLMYASDYQYTFANGVDDEYYLNSSSSTDDTRGVTSWLYHGFQWTISAAYYKNDSGAYYITEIFSSSIIPYANPPSSSDTYPVVYLKSDIKLQGTGSSDDPYEIMA